MNLRNTLNKLIIFFGLVVFSFTFWLFSRFTVDDAFIGWRYGKNFIKNYTWNYNPDFFDFTQAYTSPIYAFLSVIPNFFNWDVVFFFKIFSIVNLILFIFWYLKNTEKSFITLLLLISMPASIIHIFSGLETFLYVCFLSALFVSLDKNEKILSYFLVLFLFLIRPETWILGFLVPIFFLFSRFELASINKYKMLDLKKFIFIGTGLVLPLFLYLYVNFLHFRDILPNTYYLKLSTNFDIIQFVLFSILILPIILLQFTRRYKIFLLILIFSIVIAYRYSNSVLLMNYAARFQYHIFFPIFVFLIYVSNKYKTLLKIKIQKKTIILGQLKNIIKIISVIFLLYFYKVSGFKHFDLITYYPRLLDAHGELGKALSKNKKIYQINSFAINDAGIAPYLSDLRTLDTVGLASNMVVSKGIEQSLKLYNPDIVIINSYNNNYKFNKIYEFVTNEKISFQCDIFFKENYILKIYSRYNIDGIRNVCESSKNKNNKTDHQYIQSTWHAAPWKYWVE